MRAGVLNACCLTAGGPMPAAGARQRRRAPATGHTGRAATPPPLDPDRRTPSRGSCAPKGSTCGRPALGTCRPPRSALQSSRCAERRPRSTCPPRQRRGAPRRARVRDALAGPCHTWLHAPQSAHQPRAAAGSNGQHKSAEPAPRLIPVSALYWDICVRTVRPLNVRWGHPHAQQSGYAAHPTAGPTTCRPRLRPALKRPNPPA